MPHTDMGGRARRQLGSQGSPRRCHRLGAGQHPALLLPWIQGALLKGLSPPTLT